MITITLQLLLALVVFIPLLSAQYLNDTRRIPEIKQGQKCIKGLVYKMDCNTCHCGAQSTLLCTKMACLDNLKKPKGGLRTKEQACTPGKLYKKGCQKCFCNEKKRLKCSPSDCTLAARAYINPEHIRPLTPEDFYQLPSLAHQGLECEPGLTYRIDCNTCFCRETRNLMCQKLLCPSFADFYRIKAHEMLGKPCNAPVTDNCLECQCIGDKLSCETKPGCQHTDGRRMLHGEFPSDHDRDFIDVEHMDEKCKPGMVYKVHCNKCYCQDDGSMRCTQKSCLNFSAVEKLKKLKAKLEEEEQDDDKGVTTATPVGEHLEDEQSLEDDDSPEDEDGLEDKDSLEGKDEVTTV